MKNDENKKTKDRGWVKNVAIVFLAALAVLTFFSNTILNRSLPEVSGVTAYGGEISTAVRVSGTVETSDAYYPSLAGTEVRQISSILVRAGDYVEAGQVLFELQPLDNDNSDAVRAAQKRVQTARDAYESELIGHASSDYDNQVQHEDLVTALAEVKAKDAKLNSSLTLLANLQTAWDNAKTTAELRAEELADINQQIADVDAGTGYTVDERLQLEKYNENVSKNESALADAELNLMYVQSYDSSYPNYAQMVSEAQQQVTNCQLSVASSKVVRDEYKKKLDDKYAKSRENLVNKKNAKTKEVTAADRAVDDALKALIELQIETGMLPLGATAPSTTKLDQAVRDSARAVRDAEVAVNKQDISSNKTDAERVLRLNALLKDIEDAQYELNKLVGNNGEQANEVKSRYAGIVLNIMSDIYVGKEVQPQAQLAQIEINGKGFTLTKSVTNAEAQRVRIGDIGSISSWGMNNVVLTLAAIKTDPKNPSTNKILEFDIDGEVMSGQNLEFTIGTRSQYYEMIVPNSAVRPSANGNMVLVATAKSTPLGTRYIATPVEVEIVDSDSTNTAIRGDLGWSPFIITTANKPVEAGTQVRLAG